MLSVRCAGLSHLLNYLFLDIIIQCTLNSAVFLPQKSHFCKFDLFLFLFSHYLQNMLCTSPPISNPLQFHRGSSKWKVTRHIFIWKCPGSIFLLPTFQKIFLIINRSWLQFSGKWIQNMMINVHRIIPWMIKEGDFLLSGVQRADFSHFLPPCTIFFTSPAIGLLEIFRDLQHLYGDERVHVSISLLLNHL